MWIAVALLATGYVGMQFVGGNIPAGPRARHHDLGQQRFVDAGRAAAVHLDGRNPVPHQTVGGDVPRASRPGSTGMPGRLMHVNVLACGIFGSVSGSSAATCATVAKIALPELKKRGYDEMVCARLARRGRHARHPDPAVDHHGGLCGGRRMSRSSRCFSPASCPDLSVMVLYSGYIAVLVAAQSGRTPPAEPAMSFREKLARIQRSSIPLMLLIVLVFLVAAARLGDRDRMRRLGRAGFARHRLVARRAAAGTSFWASVMGATRVTCMIMLILAGASYMSTSMAYTGIPAALASWVDSLQLSAPTR